MYPWVLPHVSKERLCLKENILYLLKQLLVWLYTWLNQLIISLNKRPLSYANRKHADHNFSKQPPET